MVKRSTYINSWLTVIVLAIAVNFALARGVNAQKSDSSYLRALRARQNKSILKTGLHLALPPLKPAATSSAKINLPRADDKLLTNVQVTTLVTDVINLKYTLSRNATVNVKIMDVLGNDVLTLTSQRVETGDQNFTFSVANKLQKGFYFLRIVVGNETVNRRISVVY
ncbi:T9SS type A sorting domain-containing protein [Mucilaginibacter sp. 21P]|uniref:T9SS type A sorting domain-containing protein n=1 Tax=Mucilaginibacter sp. 21P TaxID=2778902 RepID=UPI001C5746F8|nr:T9SS type A sorting domain-containing protein [Mucilaginibacter sp. 21P]QXV67148.1 T9SS type A sorting domain-containing protein [Mucilaginibacter sp. 21P]